jgi:serine/threonine protein kinase
MAAGDISPAGPLLGDRFQILELVGSGGLGDVYRARDQFLNRDVAVKRFKKSLLNDDRKMAEHIWREAMSTASFQHPNIVQIFDFGLDAEGAYVVMELIVGETIEQAVERGPLHQTDFRRFADGALQGLGAAHAQGIIHRDVKPGNFMLQAKADGPFSVKILDFGLARYAGLPRPQTLDHHNSLIGSIHYMAPEQFQRRPVDHRTDLYSLGCIFYEAMTGHTAFDGETMAEIMGAHLERDPYPMGKLREDLTCEMESWILKFLAKDPRSRFQTAEEAWDAFPER